jgi:hypothetical protein
MKTLLDALGEAWAEIFDLEVAAVEMETGGRGSGCRVIGVLVRVRVGIMSGIRSRIGWMSTEE